MDKDALLDYEYPDFDPVPKKINIEWVKWLSFVGGVVHLVFESIKSVQYVNKRCEIQRLLKYSFLFGMLSISVRLHSSR